MSLPLSWGSLSKPKLPCFHYQETNDGASLWGQFRVLNTVSIGCVKKRNSSSNLLRKERRQRERGLDTHKCRVKAGQDRVGLPHQGTPVFGRGPDQRQNCVIEFVEDLEVRRASMGATFGMPTMHGFSIMLAHTLQSTTSKGSH